jgi:hypothetical protein
MSATRALLFLLAAAPIVLPQEPEPAEPAKPAAEAAPAPEEADARALFAAAVLRHKNAPEQVARATIEPEPPAAGGNMGVVMRFGAFGGGEPFTGEVEAWRGEDGATVVVSREELPGFCLYADGDRTVRQATFEEEPASLAEVEAELVPLLDPARFAKHFMNAKLEVRRDEASGDWVFEGPVSRNLVRVTKTEGHMPAKRVIRTEAKVVLTAEGALRRVKVKVVHSDPMQEMMNRGGGRVIVGVGGGQQQPPKDEDEDEPHDVEGDSVTYALDFGPPAPSDRARAFKREVLRMLGKAE